MAKAFSAEAGFTTPDADDKSLEAEDNRDQRKGNLKDAGEKAKDAFKD